MSDVMTELHPHCVDTTQAGKENKMHEMWVLSHTLTMVFRFRFNA